MVQALELSVVRIYGKQGKIVGAGFLISPEYLLTCAHVVASALGIAPISLEQPKELIQLDFPIIKAGKILTASVEVWVPVKPNCSPEDIAVLKLIDPMPVEAQPISLVSLDEDLSGHEFKAFGFPEGRSNGVWAEGVLKGRVAYGWIQIEDIKSTGYRLEEGFSGTAIWDKKLGGVVGIAVAADKKRPEAKAAFCIPTHLLLTVWDQLPEICSIQRRKTELITLLQPYFETLKDKIAWAYQQVLYEKTSINLPSELPGSLDELVTKLNQFIDGHCSYLNIFVGYLIIRLEEKGEFSELSISLVKWLAQYQVNHQNFLKSLKYKQSNKSAKKPCLLIYVFERNNGLRLQAGLIKDIQEYSLNQEIEYKSLTQEKEIELELSELTHHVRTIFQKSLEACQSNIKLIKIFLPYKFIECDINPIDTLIMDETVPEYVQQSFGSEYEVSIGFSERLGKINPYIAKWQDKCQTLKQIKSVKSLKECLISVESSNPRNLFKKLSVDEVVGARINNIIQLSHLKSTMEVFYHAGIPVALWIRKEFQGMNHQEELDCFCQDCCLETLSAKLKAKRQKAWGEENHIGNHLSLLWDDANLVPPKHLLQMPEL
jgi:hypothetical protein